MFLHDNFVGSGLDMELGYMVRIGPRVVRSGKLGSSCSQLMD